jgi:hypothetical protein
MVRQNMETLKEHRVHLLYILANLPLDVNVRANLSCLLKSIGAQISEAERHAKPNLILLK